MELLRRVVIRIFFLQGRGLAARKPVRIMPKLVCSATKIRETLENLDGVSVAIVLSKQRISMTLIRLRYCAG